MEKEQAFLNPEEGEGFEVELITLTDEEGEEHTFELVDMLELDGNSYVALIATEGDFDEQLDEGDLVLMKIIVENGEEILEVIEDNEEFETVGDIFMSRLSDLYDFEEEQDD